MNPPRATPFRRRRRTKNPRPLGAFFLFLGGFLLYFCEIVPVLDAQHHLSELGGKFTAKGTIVGFICFVFGLALAVGGAPVLRFMNPAPEKSKVFACVVAVIAAGGGVALYFWTRAYLESLGYFFRF